MLIVTRGSISRGVEVALRGRAYARRALGWIGTSEDEIEQKKILGLLAKYPEGLTESRLLDLTHSRGSVYMQRNLQMLERSGQVERAKSGRGHRYRLPRQGG